MACFSLHPRKIITTGDGGVITTNNAAYAARLKTLRQHAMGVSDAVRHGADRVIIETYDDVGYNYRMTDVQAAIGIEQVKRLDWIIQRRRELAARYTDALASHPWLQPPLEPEWAESNYQSYAVTLRPGAPISRNDLMQKLLEDGVATRRGIMLAHREKPFIYARGADRLRQSEQASAQSLLLPLYPNLYDHQQDEVVAALHSLARPASAIRV